MRRVCSPPNSSCSSSKFVYAQQRARRQLRRNSVAVCFHCLFFWAWRCLWIQRTQNLGCCFLSVFRQTALQLLLYSPPGSDLSRAQLGGKLLAGGRDREVLLLGVFCTSCCFLDLKKWLSASQALVHGWCCQMGTYCCLLWVMTVLIFPHTGFCCAFCVRNGLAWLLYEDVTTWEGAWALINSPADQ